MDRDIPVFNRPIMEKIFRKNQEKHLQRLRNIKTGYANRTTPANNFNHSISNKKAVYVEEQKKTEIEKHNVLLFNKMMRIMRRNDPNNKPNYAQLSRTTKNISENSRIVEENRGILQRIQHQRPTISNKKLQEDRMKNLNILRFLGKYPNPTASRAVYDTASTQMGRRSETKKKYDAYYHNSGQSGQFDPEDEMYDQQIRNYQQEVSKMREKDRQRNSQTASGRRKYMSQAAPRNNNLDSEQSETLAKLASVDVNNELPIPHQHRPQVRQNSRASQKSQGSHNMQGEQSRPHPSKQIVLFHKKALINGRAAAVDFLRLYSVYKIRAVFQQPFKGSQLYELEIPEQQGNQFFSENNYDYGRICSMLVVEDGYLVVNPTLEQPDVRKQTQQKQKASEHMKISKTSDIKINQPNEQWAKYEEALEESIE